MTDSEAFKIFERESARASFYWEDYRRRVSVGSFLTGSMFKLLWLNHYIPMYQLAIFLKRNPKSLKKQLDTAQRIRETDPYTDRFLLRRFAAVSVV